MDSSTDIFVFDKVKNRIQLPINSDEINLAISRIVGNRSVLELESFGNDVFRVVLRNVEDVEKIVAYGNSISINGEPYTFVTNNILTKQSKVWSLPFNVFTVLNSRCSKLGVTVDELWTRYSLKTTRTCDGGPWLISGRDPNVKRFVDKIRMILLYDSYFAEDSDIETETTTSQNDFHVESLINLNLEESDVACSSKKNVEPNIPSAAKADDVGECSICLQPLLGDKSIESLKNCRHQFHRDCLQMWLKTKPICPYCKVKNDPERGPQPEGGIFFKEFVYGHDIPEFPDAIGYIEINYIMPNGIQWGHPYTGTHRVAYLPNSERGRHISDLLKVAFDRGFTFYVGTSLTTGGSNTIVWNPLIRHKTSKSNGGRFGYPDDLYLDLVESQLNDLGIDKSSVSD